MNRKPDMIRRHGATALALSLLGTPAWSSETFAIDKVHSEVSFQIRHLMSKVRGRFTDFEGTIEADRAKPEAASVEFKVRTASVDTANETRDKDLRSPNFFEVEKYQEITFKGSKVVPKSKDQYDVIGTLTLHGVAKEVTLAVSFLGFAKDPWGGERAGFELATTLNRKDYGMVWNKALDGGGLILGDDVYVTINLEAVKKTAAAQAK